MGNHLGHSRNDNGNGEQEPLKVHLNAVANRASKFMAAWGHEFSGWVAGVFHDLGKYADQMKARLENPSQVAGRNHAATGAYWIAYHYKNSLPLALAVLSHVEPDSSPWDMLEMTVCPAAGKGAKNKCVAG